MTIEKITSTRNAIAVLLRSLKDRRSREENGMFLAEGEKMLSEALKCGLSPKILFFEESKSDGIKPMFEKSSARAFEVTQAVLNSVCDTVTPQGCACAFGIPDELCDDISLWPQRLIALDGVQDPGNVGTIWRTADAAGFLAVIASSGCADMMSPKVLRASMGSGFRLPHKSDVNLSETLEKLKSAGYDVIVSSLNGEAFYSRGDIRDKFVLVVGSEARGVSREVDNQATKRLKLPMRGGAESLNAAVAAGIMMYELTKGLDSVQ